MYKKICLYCGKIAVLGAGMVTASLKLVYAFKNEKVGAFTFVIIIELQST